MKRTFETTALLRLFLYTLLITCFGTLNVNANTNIFEAVKDLPPRIQPLLLPQPEAPQNASPDDKSRPPSDLSESSPFVKSVKTIHQPVSDDTPKVKSAKLVDETSQALRVILGLTVLAILPAILVSITAFLRIIIVLSMLRHAIGMPETPPNSALIGIALFLTLFTMNPTLQAVNEQSFSPYMKGTINAETAYDKASAPMRDFMVRQTREQDLALMVELSKAKPPESMDDISNLQLIPAFMLSELRSAFQIGFVIFLPFLLIDLIVSSILMALGMMMMPPISIALPLKILMFILVDGWSLVLKAIVGSFH